MQDQDKQKAFVGETGKSRRSRLLSRKAMLVALGVLAILLVAGFLIWKDDTPQHSSDEADTPDTAVQISKELSAMNEYLQAGNDAKSAEHARKALAHAPDDMDTMLAVAEAIKRVDIEESQQLYVKALEVFKQQDDPDAEGKNPVTYWSAGTMAEGAGLVDQAIVYYRKALEAADSTNTDDQNITAKTKEALWRLEQ